MSPEHPVRESAPEAPSRAYRSPRLVRYGSIVDLTASQQAGMGILDGSVVAVMGKINFLKSA